MGIIVLWRTSGQTSQEVGGQIHPLLAAPPLRIWGALVPVTRRLKALGASPPFAGNKANVISLAVRVDPPRLPPLLITGIDYMQHIPKAEAQGLAQEATVLGLVVVKQGPGRQVAVSQRLAEDSSHPETQPRGSGPGVYSKVHLLMSLPHVPWIPRNPRTVWEPKAQLLRIIATTINCHSVYAV